MRGKKGIITSSSQERVNMGLIEPHTWNKKGKTGQNARKVISRHRTSDKKTHWSLRDEKQTSSSLKFPQLSILREISGNSERGANLGRAWKQP